MKLKLTAVAALAAVLTIGLAACSGKDEGMTTTTNVSQTQTTRTTTVSDTSKHGIISEVSEKISEGMSEAKSELTTLARKMP